MNPTATDPAQKNMMLMMPVMFTFIFLTTAAGTALYWLISNIWGIGQQYFYELADRATGRSRRQAGGGTAPQERGHRTHRRRGEALIAICLL